MSIMTNEMVYRLVFLRGLDAYNPNQEYEDARMKTMLCALHNIRIVEKEILDNLKSLCEELDCVVEEE